MPLISGFIRVNEREERCEDGCGRRRAARDAAVHREDIHYPVCDRVTVTVNPSVSSAVSARDDKPRFRRSEKGLFQCTFHLP